MGTALSSIGYGGDQYDGYTRHDDFSDYEDLDSNEEALETMVGLDELDDVPEIIGRYSKKPPSPLPMIGPNKFVHRKDLSRIMVASRENGKVDNGALQRRILLASACQMKKAPQADTHVIATDAGSNQEAVSADRRMVSRSH